jgi:phage-related protein
MAWTVEYLSGEVETELRALPKDMQAKFLRIVQLIERSGLDRVHEPYVKHIQGRLWEMRMTGRDGISGHST